MLLKEEEIRPIFPHYGDRSFSNLSGIVDEIAKAQLKKVVENMSLIVFQKMRKGDVNVYGFMEGEYKALLKEIE